MQEGTDMKRFAFGIALLFILAALTAPTHGGKHLTKRNRPPQRAALMNEK